MKTHAAIGLFIALSITGGMILLTKETVAQSDLLQIVKERRQLMFDIQSALWPMFEIKNEESTNLKEAADSAQDMIEAMSKFMALFPVGTAKGEIPYTRATPEIWSDAEGFKAAAEVLKAEAASAKKVADADDIEAFKARFDALLEACTGCHDLKPSGGGKYRFALE